MEIIDFIFRVLKNVSDVDVNEINKLQDKAKKSLEDAHTESGGIKGLYKKLHQGWILQVVLMAALPFVIAKLKVWLFKMYNPEKVVNRIREDDEDDDYDDYEDAA